MPPLLCFSLWVWVQSALLFLVKQNLHRTRRPAMFCILHHIETDSPTFISHYLFHSFILLYTIYIYYSPRYIHTKYYFKIIWITCFRQSSCIFKTLDIFSMLLNWRKLHTYCITNQLHAKKADYYFSRAHPNYLLQLWCSIVHVFQCISN